MTSTEELDRSSELLTVFLLFAVSAGGLYFGWPVMYHYGSHFSAGIGAISMAIGGASQAEINQMVEQVVSPKPGMKSWAALIAGTLATLVLNGYFWGVGTR